LRNYFDRAPRELVTDHCFSTVMISMDLDHRLPE
jgi:hypothetical protein